MINQNNVINIGVARRLRAMRYLIERALIRKGLNLNIIDYAVKQAKRLNINGYSTGESMRLAIALAEHIHLGQLR